MNGVDATPFDRPTTRDEPWAFAELISKGIATLVVLSLAGLLYLGSGGCESYCYIWPSIDTRYAPNCTERKFAKIEIGMTSKEVVALVGRPWGTHAYYARHPAYHEWGDQVWSYTQDGAAPWGDWAWLSREVIFRNGRVVQKVYWTYYD